MVDQSLVDSPVLAYTARWHIQDGSRPPRDCLILVIRPELLHDEEEVLDIGGHAFLCTTADRPAPPQDIHFIIPIMRAFKGTPSRSPFPLMGPEEGHTDVGLVMVTGQPGPPPLIFDASDVPEGQYWIHTQSDVVPVLIWHPQSRPVGRPGPK